MKIENISDQVLSLESGSCKPGDLAEVTGKELKFLTSQGLGQLFVEEEPPEEEPPVAPPVTPAKKAAPKKAAKPKPPGFM